MMKRTRKEPNVQLREKFFYNEIKYNVSSEMSTSTKF